MTTNRLDPGQRLNDQPNSTIVSPNGRYSFTLKPDTVLVLKDNGTTIWFSSNASLSNRHPICTMQTDGILTVKINTGATVWQSSNPQSSGAHLEVRDQGDAVILDTFGTVIWSTSQSFIRAAS
jgi:hypothetical protein